MANNKVEIERNACRSFFETCYKLEALNLPTNMDLFRNIKSMSLFHEKATVIKIARASSVSTVFNMRYFEKAYRENSTDAMKLLFFVRDENGGLGLKYSFRAIIGIMACSNSNSQRSDVIRNLSVIFNVGGLDDLIFLTDTPCSSAVYKWIRELLKSDLASMKNGGLVSLLARSLPSLESTNTETLKHAKAMAKSLRLNESEYKRTVSKLRWYSYTMEEKLSAMGYELHCSKPVDIKHPNIDIMFQSKAYMDRVLKRRRYQAT